MLVVLYHGQFLVLDPQQGEILPTLPGALGRAKALCRTPEELVSVLCVLDEDVRAGALGLLKEQDDEG